MLKSDLINEQISNQDQKVFLKDSDISTTSLFRKSTVDSYLIFLKKGESFELIRVNGVDEDIANSFQIDKDCMIYSLLKSTDVNIEQREVLSSCKESVFFHKESSQKLRQEIAYWESLGLENFYPVRDKVHGLIGFVVFSLTKKKIGNSNVKKFQALMEDNIRNAFEGISVKNKDNDIALYKGLYELLRDMLELNSDDINEKVFNYFHEVLNASSAIMYVLQDKYYVPLKYKKVSFIKPLGKNSFNDLKKVALIKIETGSLLFDEMGIGQSIVMNVSKKVLFIFKIKESSLNYDLSFLNSTIDILGKYLDD
ncbi:MAG: hypothetical protein WCH76_00300 [Candidatus Riflemargulisbacteria bacterium]